MPYSDEDIATLRKALASGIKRVSYAGPPAREIEYQSVADMERALARMISENAAAAGTRSSYRFAAYKKGV